jgi:D-threo-aldose 1-dehydrogenase
VTRPARPNPAERLCLALASAGARPGGTLAEDVARPLLETAAAAGIRAVTSRPEGDVERALGQAWPFPSPFRVDACTAPLAEGLDRVEARARRSLERMGLPRGETLLVSRAADLAGAEGRALWDRLERLKAQGLYRRIGLCAGPEDAPGLLSRRFTPDVVRVPCNLLDQRALHGGALENLVEAGIEVQVSAVFAHGLLFAGGDAGVGHTPGLSRTRRRLAEARLDPMQAALAFGLSLPGAPTLVVSCASAAELRAMLAAVHAGGQGAGPDWAEFALEPAAAETLMDPATAFAA